MNALSAQQDGKSCVEQLGRKIYSGVQGDEEEEELDEEEEVEDQTDGVKQVT